MLVRDALDLSECDYPWMDGVAGEIEHNNLTVTVIMKDTQFNMVDDWGSFEAEPSYNLDNLVALGALHLRLALRRLHPGAHGQRLPRSPISSTTSAEKMERATAEMWKMMAELDPRADGRRRPPRLLRARSRSVAHFAGVYEQDDWIGGRAPAPRRFKPLMNDEYGGSADRRAGRAGLAHLPATAGRSRHGALLERARRDVDLRFPTRCWPTTTSRRGVRPDRAPASLDPGGENGEVDDDPGQADPGGVQRRRRTRSARARTSCAHYDDDSWREDQPRGPAQRRAGLRFRGSLAVPGTDEGTTRSSWGGGRWPTISFMISLVPP